MPVMPEAIRYEPCLRNLRTAGKEECSLRVGPSSPGKQESRDADKAPSEARRRADKRRPKGPSVLTSDRRERADKAAQPPC